MLIKGDPSGMSSDAIQNGNWRYRLLRENTEVVSVTTRFLACFTTRKIRCTKTAMIYRVNTLMPRKKITQFADGTLTLIFLHCMMIQLSLKFIPGDPVINKCNGGVEILMWPPWPGCHVYVPAMRSGAGLRNLKIMSYGSILSKHTCSWMGFQLWHT